MFVLQGFEKVARVEHGDRAMSMATTAGHGNRAMSMATTAESMATAR